ncbi:hypothetical protein ACH5RR_018480 [Cinchona calisaya]|uniref:SANT domain-containing protein n=1 Tax=Cinchona calisaya TaxID=153742 RepID=A0ABD2ZN84_9GENT
MDSDLFDDILSDNAVKAARAGGKFQPKSKPRGPRLLEKDSGAPSLTSSEPVRTIDASQTQLNEICEIEKPAASYDDTSVGVVNASSKHCDSAENVDSIAALGPVVDVFLPDGNEDWDSCFEKSIGENTDIFIGLESLGDFLPDSTNVMDNSVPSSEASSVHVAGSKNTEHGLVNPLIPVVDDSVCMSNVPNVPSQREFSAAQDPLTAADPIVGSTGGLSDDRNLEAEEMETYQLDTLDMSELTTSSGQQTGKFQPKSKMQAHRQGRGSSIPNLAMVDPVTCQLDSHPVPQSDVVNQRSVSASKPSKILDFSLEGRSHAVPAQSTSEVLADEEPRNLMGASHQGAGVLGEHLEAVLAMPPGKLVSRRPKTGKGKSNIASDYSPKEQMVSTSSETNIGGRSLRNRTKHNNAHKLMDEFEDEDLEGGDLPAEPLSNSFINEDADSDEEFRLEDESQTKGVRKKFNNSAVDKEKPVRKRKKNTEASDTAAKTAPKKFSHSTRRRRVDKALLETPEDEIDFQKVPLRDLILLAEYKERMAKKESTTSQAPLPNQSNGNYTACDNEDGAADAFEQYGDDKAIASEQGGEANDEQESTQVEENSGYFNYQTYMDKTPIARWSKQDTELFYEAVRQFGTDLSMIQQLFPGRTRRQIKLKYKKEERQHPLMLREALSNRAKDHSHFELVIERLKQMAAEEKQDSSKAESISLMGEEVEEEIPETNDEEARSEQIDKGIHGNMEPGFPETQSLVKSDDSEDYFFRWSQYKSEM